MNIHTPIKLLVAVLNNSYVTFQMYKCYLVFNYYTFSFQSALSVFCDGFYRLERDFIILGEICRGRFGVCFEILDIRSGKKFAMKQVKKILKILAL